jgi:competence protein ComEA
VDPSAAPWRTLESAAPGADVPEPEPGGPRSLQPTALAAVVGAAALAVVAFFLAFGSGGGELRLTGGAPRAAASDLPTDGSAGAGGLVVEVVGAVVRPGVYRFHAGARVGDLIERAGGYGPRVDVDRAGLLLNLAAPLRDGDQVRVPSRDDANATGAPGSGGAGLAPGGLVDLNGATSAELESLPGIGPATATKIIAAREEQPFTAIDELRGRKLVGEKTFEKLRDLVTVR